MSEAVEPVGKFVEANGLNIHYQETGSGVPLILLHGGSANLQSFDAQVPAFAGHFRVIALDSRGHGRTVNPDGKMSYAGMADDVIAFIDALKLDKPLVLGYSDGGQIALEIGVHYPDRVRALVLGGTVHTFTDTYFETLKGWGFISPGNVDIDQMDEGWVEYMTTAHPRDNDPDYWKSLLKQLSYLWLDPIHYTDEDFKKATPPTLLVMGDRDAAGGVDQAIEMYKRLPNAELLIIPNADHGGGGEKMSDPMVIDFLVRHSTGKTEE